MSLVSLCLLFGISYFGLKRPTDNVFTVCNWKPRRWAALNDIHIEVSLQYA